MNETNQPDGGENQPSSQPSSQLMTELMQRKTWYRPLVAVVVYILLLLFGRSLVMLYLLAAIVQWGLSLFLGEPNAMLKSGMTSVNRYIQALMEYLAMERQDPPFPFTLLP